MTAERKQLPTEGEGTIVYYSQKDKKHISRRGKHDEKSRIDTNKKGEEYYVYYDLDAWGYRTAKKWSVR
jgi:hypothetical protein|tara:strand:- start:833 stop:1039 length:207 start_codon:yes stop_codon:yes gene_type:complete